MENSPMLISIMIIVSGIFLMIIFPLAAWRVLKYLPVIETHLKNIRERLNEKIQ